MNNNQIIDIATKRFKEIVKTGFLKFKTLPNWLNKESTIFKKETQNSLKTYAKYKRGQIIKVDFGINIGSELCYTHFAIVLNKDDNIHNENILVIPITSKNNGKSRISLGKILLQAYPKTKNII